MKKKTPKVCSRCRRVRTAWNKLKKRMESAGMCSSEYPHDWMEYKQLKKIMDAPLT